MRRKGPNIKITTEAGEVTSQVTGTRVHPFVSIKSLLHIDKSSWVVLHQRLPGLVPGHGMCKIWKGTCSGINNLKLNSARSTSGGRNGKCCE